MPSFPPNRKPGLLVAGLLLFTIIQQTQASPLTSPSRRTQKILGWAPAVAAGGALLASQGDCWFGWKIVTDPLTDWVQVVPCQDVLPPLVPPQVATPTAAATATPRPTLTPTLQPAITTTQQASAIVSKTVTPNPATMTAQAQLTQTATAKPRSPVRVQFQNGAITYSSVLLEKEEDEDGVTVAQVTAGLTVLLADPNIPKRYKNDAAIAYQAAIRWVVSRPPNGVCGLVKKSFPFPSNPDWRFDVDILVGCHLKK